ncbi:MAG: hypothetical protein ACHQWU_05000 [Gemmatimonadales bacterium]
MRRTSGVRALRFWAIAAVLSTAAAHAQSGSWILGVGVGQGSGWPTCASCATISHRQGLSGYGEIERALSPTVAVGVELSRWANYQSDANSQFDAGLIVGTLTAEPGRGIALTIGAGVAQNRVDFISPSGQDLSTGFAYLAGLAYRFPLTSRFTLSPFGDYTATAGAQATAPFGSGTETYSFNGNLLRFGIELAWR